MIRIVILYAIFALFATAYAVLTPPGEAPDEMPHLQHVDFLLHEKRIPHRFEDDIYQDHHPPLYYATAAAALRLGQTLDPRFTISVPGPYRVAIDLAEPAVDREALERGAAAVPPLLREELTAKANLKERHFAITRGQFTVVRLLSVLLALLTLACVHRTARLVLPGRPSAVTLTVAFAALLPQFQFLGGIINCDIMAVFTANLLLYRLTHALVAGDLTTVRRSVEIGAFLGLCLLSKMSGIAMLAPVGVAYLFALRLAGLRQAATGLGVALAAALVVGGWWYGLNAMRYGDPFMVAAQAATMGEQIHQPPFNAHYFAAYFHDTIRSFFGQLGPYSIPIADWTFYGYVALLGLALTGLLLRFAPRPRITLAPGGTAALWVLAAGFLATWVVVFRGNLTFYSSQGRYLFPGLAAVAIACGLGVTEALRPRLALRTVLHLLLLVASVHVLTCRFLPEYYPRREAVERPLVVRYENAGHPHLSSAHTVGVTAEAWGGFGGRASQDARTVRGALTGFHFDRLPPAEAYRVRIRFGEYFTRPEPWRYPLQTLQLDGRTVAGALMVTSRPRELVFTVPSHPKGANAVAVEAAAVPGFGPFATVSALWIERAPLQPRGIAVRGGAVKRGQPLTAELTVANIHPSEPRQGRVALVLVTPRGAVRLGEPIAFSAAPGREARIRMAPKLPEDLPIGRARVLAFLALDPGSPFIDLNPCIAKGSGDTITPSPVAFGRFQVSTRPASETGENSLHLTLPLPALPAGRYRVRVTGRTEATGRLEVRLRSQRVAGEAPGAGSSAPQWAKQWAKQWEWIRDVGGTEGSTEIEVGGPIDWPPGAKQGEIEIRGEGRLAVDRIRVIAEWVQGVNLITFPHESTVDVR